MPAIERFTVAGHAAPAGHYSPAVAYGDLVFVSGQLPAEPDGTHRPDAAFDAQTRKALTNLFAALAAAGSSPEKVLKVTVFMVGAENWPVFNAIYAEMFGASKPARSAVPVPALNRGYLVEVEAVAVR